MITVAMPVYKSQYLQKAIESVINQSYKELELIILNDHSPDENIESIISNFNDSRIKYIKNESNIGNYDLTEVWNQCLNLAQGEYFVLFSDDDIYHQDFLKEMILLSEKYHKVEIFHCRVKIIDKNDRTISYTPLCPEWENVMEFVWHRLKYYRLQYAPDFMCRTTSLKEKGGFIKFPLGWGSDDATWFTMSKRNGVAYTNKVLCNWRFSSLNISHIGALEKRLSAINLYSEWLKNFLNKLNIEGDKERDLFIEIRENLNGWRENAQRTVLFRNKKKSFHYITLFREWFRYRKKYNISFKTFTKALFSIIQTSRLK